MYVCLYTVSMAITFKNMKLGYNVYYVLFDLWYKWLLYISKVLCVATWILQFHIEHLTLQIIISVFIFVVHNISLYLYLT